MMESLNASDNDRNEFIDNVSIDWPAHSFFNFLNKFNSFVDHAESFAIPENLNDEFDLKYNYNVG